MPCKYFELQNHILPFLTTQGSLWEKFIQTNININWWQNKILKCTSKDRPGCPWKVCTQVFPFQSFKVVSLEPTTSKKIS